MKKLFTTALILTAVFTAAFAQQNKCATDEVMKQEIAKNPQILFEQEEFERGFQEYLANQTARHDFDPAEKMIIPIVFHVIHQGLSENISKAQIQDQVDILNKCIRHQNSDSTNTPAPFLALAGGLNVEFRLAKKDPMGNCSEGITRTFSTKTDGASNQNGVKALAYWNCYSYFNVWVVERIGLELDGGGIILGYAQFPASGLCGTDGVVMLNTYTGSIGTANSTDGKTLVHEVGHWFSLIHTWGDAQCGSDQVNDTPNQFGPNFGVCYNSFPYVPDPHCDGLDTTTGEMMVNYMDYSNDECMNMFTIGQCERMNYTLKGVSGNNGLRSDLWSEENSWLTGTHDDFVAGECAPIADFVANKTFACSGVTIGFTDKSYNGSVTSRSWSFPGATTVSSTTNATTNVTYDTPGVYEVTLSVLNATGSDTETKTSYIYINNDAAQVNADYTYFEDFESQSNFDSKWVVINPDNTSHKWEITGGLYTPSGGGVLRVSNYGNITTEYEEVISPSYNLSNLTTPVVLKYKYSGSTTTYLGDHNGNFTVDGDEFRVYYSSNCGQNWSQIAQLALTGESLINAGLYSNYYIPNSQSIWTEKQTNLSSTITNQDNVRFKFVYTVGSGYGNNFYLDAIRIENITGVEELKSILGVQVFPNPTNGLTRISLNTPENGKLSLKLMDVLGREISAIYNGSVNAGDQIYNVDANSIDAGIYFLQINYNDKTTAIKLVVQ